MWTQDRVLKGLVSALLLAASAAGAQELSWVSLPGAAQAAPAAQASQWQAQAALERRGLLGRSFQPRLNAAALGTARARDGSASSWPEVQAGLNWDLWRGGRDQAASRATDAAAQASSWDAAAVQAEVLLALRKSFLLSALLKKKLAITAEAATQSEEDLARAKKKASAGLTSQTDVREFELRLLALQMERTGLEDSLDVELANLAVLAGVPQAELGGSEEGWPEIPGPIDGVGVDEGSQSAKAESERRQAEAQGRWPLPGLDLGLGLIQGGENGAFLEQRDYRATAGLSLSLWDGGEAAAARASLENSARSFEALALSARNARQASANLARRRLERWTGLRVSLEKRVEAAVQFRQGVIQEYLRGVRDGRDLEEASKDTQEAQTDLEEARSAAWEAWSDLQRQGISVGSGPSS